MKLKLFLRLSIAVCLSAIIVLAFSACKEKQVYAEKDDFESYPEEYWNGYNNNSSENIYGPGDIIIDGNSSPDDSNNSDDPNANFTENDENPDNPFKEPDNDNDGIPDNEDPDDDNDGIPDDDDDDSNGNDIPDDEEKPITNQGPLVMF